MNFFHVLCFFYCCSQATIIYLLFPGEGKLLLDQRLASILHPNSLQLTETLNNWVNVTVSEFISFFFVLKYYFNNRRAIVISPRIFKISKIESPDEAEFEIIETMLEKVLELGLDFLEEFFVINKIDTGLVQEVNHKIVCEFLLLFVRKIHGSLLPAIFDSFCRKIVRRLCVKSQNYLPSTN